MALFDKLNRMARSLGEMTNEVIENTRSTSKVSTERSAAEAEFKKIGEYYYNRFINGEPVAEEVLEACESARAHLEAAAQMQAEIDRIRMEKEAEAERIRLEREAEMAAAREEAPAGITCPNCGMENGEGTKFCCECGTRLPLQEPQERYCPSCGTAVQPGMRFCSECGQRMAE